MHGLRTHVIETGRLTGNQTFLRGEGWSSLLRPRRDYQFPAYCFVIEHPQGLIAIDTGLNVRARSPRPRWQRRFVPDPMPGTEIGPAMRAIGLDPADVRLVVLTHLDWDHAGGLAHFPNAEVLVHRTELEFAATFLGRRRFEADRWPRTFDPTVYELDPEPYGPFPESRLLTDDGAVRLVPIPGHTPGQVGVIARSGDRRQFFCADHVLRQDWFLDDYARDRLLGLGIFFPELARETSRRIHAFIESVPTVLVPSHDAEAPARLAATEPADAIAG
jgi:N-acyl homoserine lactone hydrolase